MNADDRRAVDGAKTIEVTLLGRSYRVACGDDEREALLQAVAYLEGKMGEIKKSGKVAGTERIAVMAALNIAHEFLTTKVGGGFDIAEIKRRMAGMETVIDRALSEQDELF